MTSSDVRRWLEDRLGDLAAFMPDAPPEPDPPPPGPDENVETWVGEIAMVAVDPSQTTANGPFPAGGCVVDHVLEVSQSGRAGPDILPKLAADQDDTHWAPHLLADPAEVCLRGELAAIEHSAGHDRQSAKECRPAQTFPRDIERHPPPQPCVAEDPR